MTKLDAVNDMLEAIGEPPVDQLDTGGDSIVADAERLLDSQDKRIQTEGWAVNSDYEVELEPNGSDEINPGADVVRFNTAGRDRKRRIIIRDGKLYDHDNNTATFTSPVFADLVELVDFEDLPHQLATYIVQSAAVRFVRLRLGASEVDLQAREQLALARIAAEKENSDLLNTNVLETPGAIRVKGSRNDTYAKRP